MNDPFQVVDCLLPGQIRQLGARVTYLTERRPVRTTAEDCTIRGGEFVASDRADYKTSLKVWLDAAQAGDPEAQYYVGTLYEKGADGDANYPQAAAWYRKAAEQGDRRAAISLGRLYEQGWGVGKNPAQAFAWFAKASGLNEANLSLLANKQAITRMRVLERTITEKEQEIGRLRQELGRVGKEIAGLQAEIRVRTDQADTQRRTIREQEQKLTSLRAELRNALAQPKPAVETTALQRQVQDLAGEIARKQAEVIHRNEEIAHLQARVTALEKTESRIGTLEQTVAVKEQEAQRLRDQLTTANRHLQNLDAELKDRLLRSTDNRRKLQDLDERYQRALAELERLRTKPDQTVALEQQEEAVRRLQQEVDRSRHSLEERNKDIARLQQRIAMLEQEAEERTKQLQITAAVDLGFDGPTIEILDPPLLRTRGVQVVKGGESLPVIAGKHTKITGRVLAPAGLQSLTVNGMRTNVDENGIFVTKVAALRGGTDDLLVQILAVDIQNKRTALRLAIRDSGAVPGTEPPLIPPQEAAAFGRYFALVIGNDHYEHWPQLVNAIADATAVAKLLHDRYGFQITVLKDAKRHEILKALNEYRKTLTDKDNLLIYYAGHGHLEKGIDRGYWIPVDGEMNDNTNWIQLPMITDLLQLMAAKHVLVVADSCFGGKLTRNSLAQLRPGLSDEARFNLLKTLAQKRVRTAMTSGGVQPVLDAGGLGHSVFEEAFAGVLQDNTTILEAERLFWAVRARVLDQSQKLHLEQLPTYDPIHMAGHESLGDFIFVPR